MSDHQHVWVEAIVVEAPDSQQQTLGTRYALCGVCGQGKGADERPVQGLKYDFMHAQADALDATADWVDQPDEPTGARGLVTSHELRMRAIGLRVQADILGRERP